MSISFNPKLKDKLLLLWKTRTEILQSREFTTDGYRISYGVNQGKGNTTPLVIVTGLAQTYWQWMELVFDLRNAGFLGSIYVLDNRGQGASDRLITDSPDVGAILKFDDYCSDLKKFLTLVKSKEQNAPFVLGHSMGAAISTLAYQKNPELFTKLALINPMYAISRRGFLKYLPIEGLVTLAMIKKQFSRDQQLGGSNIANAILQSQSKLGRPLSLDEVFEDLPDKIENEGTSMIERAAFSVFVRMATHVRITKVTLDWFIESVQAGKKISKLKNIFDNKKAIVLTGGQDLIINYAKTVAVARGLGAHCEHLPLSDHMMFEEIDSVRERLVEILLQFYQPQLKSTHEIILDR